MENKINIAVTGIGSLIGQAIIKSIQRSDLKDKINKNPDDLDVMLEMSIALYGNGAISDSFDLLLKSIGIDREWDEQSARKQLLEFFNTTGFEAKETILARRKLASLLFS